MKKFFQITLKDKSSITVFTEGIKMDDNDFSAITEEGVIMMFNSEVETIQKANYQD